MGRLFAYQEKTGMGIEEIMRTPWLLIVLGMMDAPSIDYKEKKENKIMKAESAEEQMNAAAAFFQ